MTLHCCPTPIRLLIPAAIATLLTTGCTVTGPIRDAPTIPTPIASAVDPTIAANTERDPRLHAGPPATSSLPSPVVVPIDAATLAALPRTPVVATAGGQTQRCEGVPLAALLRAAGAMPAEPLTGAQLTRYVQVDFRRGYRVLFSLAELDPSLGNHPVFVIARCNGQPLSADEGPLRLAAPTESQPARSLGQLKSITVIVAP